MRQLKQLGIALIAILSLSIAATTAAQAVELKFLPEKAKFSFKSTGKTVLRKLGTATTVECLTVEGTGEATSERLGLIDFLFLDCLEPSLKVKCTGLNDTTTGSILVHAEYHLRHLLKEPGPEKDLILVILVLGDGTTGSTAAHFSCLGVLQTVTGCVASDHLLLDNKELWLAGQLEKLFLVNFLPKVGSLGDQSYTSVDTDNSLGMETCVLSAKQEGGTAESASQEGNGEVEKCTTSTGTECTFLIDLTGSSE